MVFHRNVLEFIILFVVKGAGMGKRKKSKPIALDAYEDMAAEYNARIKTKAYNAYIERPATLSLLPDVKGKHVLDAGCGPGFYAEILLERGAQVTAIDISPKMIEFTRKRLGNRASIRLVNLEEPLDFISDNSVDIVFSSLVLDYIKNWAPLFSEFARILKDDGYLIFSTEHPAGKWTNQEHPRRTIKPENYFELEQVELIWIGFGKPVPVRSYRRPLSTFFECLRSTGFSLDKFVEPQPTIEFKNANPEDWVKVQQNPTFLCIRAKKTATKLGD
ncbi:MAG: class I SAM-dependent methyltransferase [Candidatus Hermodarchaeia archaeon]